MLIVNEKEYDVPTHLKDVPLVNYLRDFIGLYGTKFGCGAGLCGACTVHMDGTAKRSCQISVADVEGQKITTIEGLAATVPDNELHPVQKAWIEEAVPQCGYCQAGQIMSAAALLKQNPSPSKEEIRSEMKGNLCRCGTYGRIQQAILKAAKDV